MEVADEWNEFDSIYFVCSDPVIVRNCYSVHCAMLKKVWSYKMNMERHRVGSINSKKHNTQFPSKNISSRLICCEPFNEQFASFSVFRRIKPKLDELGSLHARHLLRPSLDDQCEEEELIEDLSQTISKLIASTHRHIQCIRSSLGHGEFNETSI